MHLKPFKQGLEPSADQPLRGNGGGAGEIETEIEFEYIRNFVATPIDTTHTPVGRALKGRRFGVQ